MCNCKESIVQYYWHLIAFSVICCEKLANVKYSAKQAKKTSLQRQFYPTSKEHQL